MRPMLFGFDRRGRLHEQLLPPRRSVLPVRGTCCRGVPQSNPGSTFSIIPQGRTVTIETLIIAFLTGFAFLVVAIGIVLLISFVDIVPSDADDCNPSFDPNRKL